MASITKERPVASEFFLFGSPIQHSLSPLLHNTAFRFHGLPCTYALFDTTDIEQVKQKLQSPTTAGGSITIPHKQTVMPALAHLSDSAQAIGAVNTVYKNDKGELCGDNTDWQAIKVLVQRRLRALAHTDSKALTGLVIGAGGTAHAACFALQNLGVPYFIWNRSIDKAEELAKKFSGKVCASIESLERVDILIATVPPTADFRLPSALVHPALVVVELVYHPRTTKLLEQVRSANCEQVVEGVEVLFEQGLRQFEIFSETYKAPRAQIAAAFVENFANGALKTNTPATFTDSFE